jgi:DNA anti-recombination protein RmuC
MCLKGILGSGKPTNPGTFEEYRLKKSERAQQPTRSEYDAAVKRFKDSGGDMDAKTVEEQQAEQEASIEEAKKTEAQKIAESKSEALEEQMSSLSAPLSSMVKRQGELGVKRKGSKGRRSLLTGSGMGYYSKFNA